MTPLKFRTILPLIQVASTLVLLCLWYSDSKKMSSITLRTHDRIQTFWVHGSPEGRERIKHWVQALNFPAFVIVLPIETAATRNEGIGFSPMATLWRFASFSIVGIYAWRLAGRACDSILAMFRGGEAILPKASDWAFSICAVLSGIVGIGMGLFSTLDEFDLRVYAPLGLWWLLVGAGAISFYIYQWRMIRKATRETDAK